MSRRLAANAKVAGRPNDAISEMRGPDSIHDHARGERICGIDNCPRELQPALSFGEWLVFRPAKDSEETAGGVGAGDVWIPAEEDALGVATRGLFNDHRVRVCAQVFVEKTKDLRLSLLQFV